MRDVNMHHIDIRLYICSFFLCLVSRIGACDSLHGIGDKYYGAKATINVWEPKIQQQNEFSLSQIWLLGGSF